MNYLFCLEKVKEYYDFIRLETYEQMFERRLSNVKRCLNGA